MKRCLIIFAKEPKRGRVKTRLRKVLTESRCLNLYKAFLKDTVRLARKLKCELNILAYDSENKNPSQLKKIAAEYTFYEQRGDSLGRRMHNAFRFASSKSSKKTVIIGSDSPTLPLDYIKNAFSQLGKNDVVLGPSHDGGYYLIGLKKPCYGIFKGIKWSSCQVIKDTLINIKSQGKSVALLNKWYDIDEPEDLRRLLLEFKRQKKQDYRKAYETNFILTKRYYSSIIIP